jgi:hypothetical protein
MMSGRLLLRILRDMAVLEVHRVRAVITAYQEGRAVRVKAAVLPSAWQEMVREVMLARVDSLGTTVIKLVVTVNMAMLEVLR